ncbi:AraC family transcriptional regulator [Dysgonomonas macrotermitis]|uniref:AraC-type DNA-binding protein n=1 Tax=Dysgonomonas macrotermitis TaxID=1346286 RepID=A0A1M4VR42_9BACT|nr:AraC family transcriptional regulator [Dysgonomonas macrotermitis]SHE71330.1 AraC-type DNA-binding protein [Dysgonomonas macrotermitis]
MDSSIHTEYLITSNRDIDWGLTVNSVGFQHIEPGEVYPPLNHPTRYLFNVAKGRILNEYQLLYITQGYGDFTSKSSTKCHVAEGNMFLLFPDEWHTYKPNKLSGWDEYWIGFSGKNMDDRVLSNFFNIQKPILNVGLQNNLVSIYLEAISIAKDQNAGFQQLLSGIVERLLSCAYAYNKLASFEEMKVVKMINKAKLIIQESLYTAISPEEVALKLNMSYSWFRKVFKQYTGFAPMQYINEMKIQKSKDLLTNTDLSNIEIAYKLGFDNPNYFCTLFKNKVKVTPMKYRAITQGRNINAKLNV